MPHHPFRQALSRTFLSREDKALWKLALPMIFSNITVPLLGLVDTAVIGHLDSADYLGGVAVGAMVTTFLFMMLLFLRMSTTGLTAQAFGAKDKLLLARAGGVFVPLAPGGPTPFIGQGLGGIAAPVSPAMPETVHQGYAPVLGLHLPETP